MHEFMSGTPNHNHTITDNNSQGYYSGTYTQPPHNPQTPYIGDPITEPNYQQPPLWVPAVTNPVLDHTHGGESMADVLMAQTIAQLQAKIFNLEEEISALMEIFEPLLDALENTPQR